MEIVQSRQGEQFMVEVIELEDMTKEQKEEVLINSTLKNLNLLEKEFITELLKRKCEMSTKDLTKVLSYLNNEKGHLFKALSTKLNLSLNSNIYNVDSGDTSKTNEEILEERKKFNQELQDFENKFGINLIKGKE